jgi:hypothetical protein
MYGYTLILFTLAMAALWAKTFPQEIIAILAELKRQLRLACIRRNGKQAAMAAKIVYAQQALQAGYEPALVEQIFQEYEGVVIERLGRQRALEILGEPTPSERYD